MKIRFDIIYEPSGKICLPESFYLVMLEKSSGEKENNINLNQTAPSTLPSPPMPKIMHIDEKLGYIALVKVFRIIPEFRILRPTFHRKSASKS